MFNIFLYLNFRFLKFRYIFDEIPEEQSIYFLFDFQSQFILKCFYQEFLRIEYKYSWTEFNINI